MAHVTDIRDLKRDLARLRLAWSAVAFACAAARWLTAALPALGLVFLADWLVVRRAAESESEDLRARATLAAILGVALLWRAWRLFAAAARTRLSEDGMALRIEALRPRFDGRLICAVQFDRVARRGGGSESPELIGLVRAEAVALWRELSLAGIVDTGPLRRAAALLCAMALLFAGLALWQRDTAATFGRRLLLGSAAYPAATRLAGVDAPALVAMGESFVVTARVDPSGVVPAQARLQVRTKEGGAATTIPMPAAPGAARDAFPAFAGTVESPTEDLAVRVLAFDARSEWRRVRVVPRPAVLQVESRYTFPAYTGLAPSNACQGDIRAVAGTSVRVVAHCSRPVRSAVLEFVPGAGAPRRTDMAVGGDGTRAEAGLVVRTNGVYTIRLLDRDGMANGTPPEWTVDALADQPPEVEIVFPAQDRLVTPTAKWPLRFLARDDFGLGEVTFRYTVQDALQTAPLDEGSRPLARAGTNAIERRADMQTWIDLAALKLQPGQQLLYWIEVTDRLTPRANVGKSRSFAFEVGDAQTVQEALRAARESAVRQLGVLAQSEEAARVHVDKTRRALRRGDADRQEARPE